ncbi:MAG: hypothetical protein LCI00_33010 [Chloroflexi bacterium]|nr:hypothetical protein [Chloroflexota bacterium]
MTYRLIIALFVVTLTLSAAHAQDTPTPEYRLRVSDVQAFITTVPEAVKLWHEALPPSYGKVPNIPLSDIISYQVSQTYTYETLFQQPFNDLIAFYEAVTSMYSPLAIEKFSDQMWDIPLFQSWLRDNPTDLSKQPQPEIPGFFIEAKAADFDGDKVNDYAVTLSFGSIKEYLVLQKDTSLKEGYKITSVLNSDYQQPFNFSNISVGAISDFNADGRSEWPIYDDYHGYHDWCKYFNVIGWGNGNIANLIAEQPTTACLSGDVEFTNLDNDTPQEIRQTDENFDNWGCLITTEVVWDWDGANYRISKENVNREATLGCAMKEAEPLMWNGDVAKAIPLYEEGIQLGWESASGNHFEQPERDEMTQYAKARLAIAYALVGRYQDARLLRAELLNETLTSEMMDTLIQNLSGAPVTSFAFCATAYNVFWRYHRTMTGYNLPSNIVVGRSNYPCCVGDNSPPEPEKAGCDAPRLIDETLSKQSFQVGQSLLEQVVATGIEVESEFHADLNGDGQDEWLIWPVARVPPILFVPNKNDLVISRPNVRRPNPFSTLEFLLAPDGKTILLVDWIYLDSYAFVSNRDGDFYDIRVGWAQCESTGQGNKGDFKIWHLKDTEMVEMLTIPLCDQKSTRTLFKDDTGIRAWSFSNANGQNLFVSATYRWDAYSKTYVSPIPLANQPTNNPHEDMPSLPSLLSDAELFNEMGKISEFMFTNRYHYALQRIDKAILYHEKGIIPLLTDGLHYYRALALEALNRPDQALTEYVAIYTTAPDSAWGKLAALHLECVANCELDKPIR